MSESKLDELAWLCLTKPDAVKLEELGLTQADVCVACEIREEGLFFQDPEDERSRAIRYIQQTVIVPAITTPPTLFKALERCWFDAREAHEGSLSGLALAQLHNTGGIDAVHMAIEAMHGGGDVFTVSRVMTRSLPLLDRIDVSNLLTMLGLMHLKMKNGLAGSIYGAVQEWMKGHPLVIDDVVSSCLAVSGEQSTLLLRVALVQGVVSQRSRWLARIHELIDDGNLAISLQAIEALGLVDWRNSDTGEIAKAAAVIRVGLRSGDDCVLLSSACAALNLVDTAHDQHALIDEVVALDKRYVVSLVGDHIGYRGEYLNMQPWYQDKIALLASKAGQNKGSYHGVDCVLSRLFKSQDKAACLQWLHTWAVANADDPLDFPEEFPQLFQLLSESVEDLGVLLAKWLTHNEVGVQKMARDIVGDVGLHGRDDLIIPPSILDKMAPSGLSHLVRRVLGNVFREGQQISLVWSLTRTTAAESRTFHLVHHVMVDFVGRDYPAATKAYLESVVSSEAEAPLGKLAHGILAMMERYQDTLDTLPMIEELRPLAEHCHRFSKERHRKMEEAFDEASKNSILHQIATTVPLKAGCSSFSVRDGNVGEKMHLTSISHSVSIPRSEAIDQVGSDLRRVQFNLGREGRE